MKNEASFLIDKSTKFKTKPHWIFLSVLVFIVIPFLIIWLLIGEFNLLNQNNIVAINQPLWHGKVTNENIQNLLVYEPFVKIDEQKTFSKMLEEWLNKDTQIIASVAYFNLLVLIPIFGVIIIGFIYPFILRLFKLFAYDILPFSITFALGFSVLFISGLWPHFNNQELFLVYWLLRILVFLASMAISFFISNFIVNKLLIKYGSNSVAIALNYLQPNGDNKQIKKDSVEK